jgi:hypothetical protein
VVPAAEPPAPVMRSTAPTPDQKVAEKIRELFATRSNAFSDRNTRRRRRPSIRRAPMRRSGSRTASKLARQVRCVLSRRGRCRWSRPADYPVPSFANADPAAMAEAELKLTASV